MFFKLGAYLVTTSLFLLHSSSVHAILGGTVDDIKNYPYLVQIWQGPTFICAGSLVSPLFVVSATDCMLGVVINQLIVVGGATSLTDVGVRRAVTKVFRRAAFNRRTFDQDLAVLKLASAMTGTNIKPIAINDQKVIPGMVMQVTGWGSTSELATAPANILRTIKLPVVSKVECQRRYQTFIRLTNTMFCAAQLGKGHCFGDTGGSAVCNGKLCGVVSGARGCARPNYPGIYTGVYSMRVLIQNALTK